MELFPYLSLSPFFLYKKKFILVKSMFFHWINRGTHARFVEEIINIVLPFPSSMIHVSKEQGSIHVQPLLFILYEKKSI
jgi:hypothetical protein